METPDDPLYYWQYVLFVPTIIVGGAISGSTLVTMVRFRGELIANRLDRLLCLILLICFTWSVCLLLRYLAALFVATEDLAGANAALSFLGLGWLLSANIMLAFSRYFVFQGRPDHETRFVFYFIAVVGITMSGLLVWIYATSDVDGIHGAQPTKNFPVQRSAWNGLVIGFGTISIASIAFIYYAIHRLISRRLSDLTVPHDKHLQIQKKVWQSCVIMALCTFVAYTPSVISLAVAAALKWTSANFPTWLYAIQGEFVLLDLVFTPMSILYFMPRIRYRLFRGRVSPKGVTVVNDNSVDVELLE
ncbi:hypothetical protein HDU82_005640 [Entophlyctis luteolus]|nr:hypothetical protein HDU82_005640 [Entophlyctis luteolus]